MLSGKVICQENQPFADINTLGMHKHSTYAPFGV